MNSDFSEIKKEGAVTLKLSVAEVLYERESSLQETDRIFKKKFFIHTQLHECIKVTVKSNTTKSSGKS